jgi:ribosomal protein S6--L-glutamate ligase
MHDTAIARGVQCYIEDSSNLERLGQQDLRDVMVLPRIAPEYNDHARNLELLEAAGAYVVNPASSWVISRDKWLTFEQLRLYEIPTPRTVRLSPGTVFSADLGVGEQAVFKPRYGTHGEGIVKIRPGDIVPREDGVVQEFIEANGTDVRLFVVGSRVVSAMQRRAKEGDFRANLHQGATAEAYVPSDDMQRVAVRAAKSMGLRVAGVDMLVNDAGAVVLEVNPSPGLGIERYTSADITGEMIEDIIGLRA